MVISLGRISLRSEPTAQSRTIISMHMSGLTNEDIMREMLQQAYDKFTLDIQDIQILLAKPMENWRQALQDGKVTDMHLLEPTAMHLSADLCVVDDDPRLPKTRISAKIPSIGISVAEDKILDAIALVTSIPLPENDDTTPMQLNKNLGIVASSMSLKRYLDEKQARKPKKPVDIKKQELSEEIIQYTDLEFAFVMNGLSGLLFDNRRRL